MKKLTPFEEKVMLHVLECAVMDPYIPLKDLNFEKKDYAAITRAYKKLKPPPQAPRIFV